MDALIYHERPPTLRQPILIAAFDGWADASEVATWSARFLVRQWNARKFSEIDPEEFFVFTEQRPQMRWIKEGQRRRYVKWPANTLYYYQAADADRDFIILVGSEPQLKWKSFVKLIMEVVRQHGVSVVLTLGAALAAVPHTQPARITGNGTDLFITDRLSSSVPVNTSRYEGPTGILGVLNTTLEQEGIPTAGIWGNVPHYLSARPNVRVALSILEQLNQSLGLNLSLRSVERQAALFDTQVNQAISGNQEVLSYIRKLEEEQGLTTEDKPREELPSSDSIVQDIEEFFRRGQDSNDENQGRL